VMGELSASNPVYWHCTSMRGAIAQRLIALVCLVAFGLGQVFFSSLGVRCTDASGVTRIEYACIKTTQGACLTPCEAPEAHSAEDNHDSDPVAPTPCEDEPLGVQMSAVRQGQTSHASVPVFAMVMVAVLETPWSIDHIPPGCVRRSKTERERPPDSLARMRCVILTV